MKHWEKTMRDNLIPESLLAWAESDDDVDAKLRSAVQLYAEALDCGRCIIYCRQPDLRVANTTHAWWNNDAWAVTWESWLTSEWVDEGPPNSEDPLYHAALVDPTAIYIGDIENDPTGLVNLEFEQRMFLHQALIHAPVYSDGRFYGVLEPSVFGSTRVWSDRDRAITEWMQDKLGPLMAAFVAEHAPKVAA
jgi:GAF domain-containing protein